MLQLRWLVIVLAVFAALGQSAGAAPIVIDDFSNSTSLAFPTEGTVNSGTSTFGPINDSAAGILGGTRTVELGPYSGGGGAQKVTVTVDTFNGELLYSSTSSAKAPLTLSYSGAFNLSGQDFLTVELNYDNAFDGPLHLTVKLNGVSSSLGSFSPYVLDDAGDSPVVIPLSSFAVNLGSITSIELLFDPQDNAQDFAITMISASAVPEPATLALFGVGTGLAGLFLARRRRAEPSVN